LNLALLSKLFEPIQSFDFDDQCVENYALIRAELTQTGQRIGANALMIAAIAVTHQATLVTNGTSQFRRTRGLIVQD
jgi:tRNA(fMet)-specific endonuclease VapC